MIRPIFQIVTCRQSSNLYPANALGSWPQSMMQRLILKMTTHPDDCPFLWKELMWRLQTSVPDPWPLCTRYTRGYKKE